MRNHKTIRNRTILLLLFIVVFGVWFYFWLFYDLPSPEKLNEYLFTSGDYSFVELGDIPKELQWAIVVTEDKDFYYRLNRTDIPTVLRSLWMNFYCAIKECLSLRAATIPQKLTVNLMLLSNKDMGISFRQSMRDLILTLLINHRYSSDTILEFYLNSIPYSNQLYGVESAAQHYFGKHVSNLDLAECTMLTAIKSLPYFTPKDSLELAKERQAVVLQLMLDEGHINPKEVEETKQAVLAFKDE